MRCFIYFMGFILIACNTSTETLQKKEQNPADLMEESKAKPLKSQRQDTVKKQQFSFGMKTLGPNGKVIDEVVLPYYLTQNMYTSQTKKDISYYYQRLPPVIVCNNREIMDRIATEEVFMNSFYTEKIIHQNIRNGYIKVKSCFVSNNSDKEHVLEVALFTSTNSTAVIVVNTLNTGDLICLQLDDKRRVWQDVTTEVFPDFSCKTPPCGGGPTRYFKLPEYGTQILSFSDGNIALPSPIDNIWKYKQQNYPEQILRIDWDMEKGKFYVKE